MGKRVMIVDDEPDILLILNRILSLRGYEVVSFPSGDGAIEAIRGGEVPDLLVLDVMMPGISGYEVCELLKKDKTTKEIPIILLSAKAQNVEIEKGLLLGADDYIVKPFNPMELAEKVEAVLGRPV